jgi:two-component system, NarL family, response regulator NreC
VRLPVRASAPPWSVENAPLANPPPPPPTLSLLPQQKGLFTRSVALPTGLSLSIMATTRPTLTAVPPDDASALATLTVVVADDHAMMRRGLRQLLEDERGITLTGEAVDLESTTQVVTEHQPDVLVLDLTMPDGSAIDILGELRAKSPQTRIVVVTMEDAPGFAQRALAAGAGGFVLKELADEDLAEAVHAVAQGDEYISAPVARRLATLRQARTDGRLTAREAEVLRLIALGHTNVEVARQLGVSARTVETHRANIHGKLELRTRAELVRYALRCGLLES